MKDVQYCLRSAMIKIEQWEVWWATVKYEDSDEEKIRPVVILDCNNAFCIDVAKVTTHKPRDLFDHQITDLESCGLHRASTVRLDKKNPNKRKPAKNQAGKVEQSRYFSAEDYTQKKMKSIAAMRCFFYLSISKIVSCPLLFLNL